MKEDVVDSRGTINDRWLHIVRAKRHMKEATKWIQSDPTRRVLMFRALKHSGFKAPNLYQFLKTASMTNPPLVADEVTRVIRARLDLKPSSALKVFQDLRVVLKS